MESAAPTNLERIREYRQRLQRDPNPLAYALLAEAFREEGMLREAEDVCRQGIERYPSYATTRVILAQILEERDDIEAAQREYEAVLFYDAGNLISRTALGRLLIKQGDMAQAAQHLEHVLFLSPGDDAARELLDVARGERPPPAEPRAPVEDRRGRKAPAEGGAGGATAPSSGEEGAAAVPAGERIRRVLEELSEIEGVAGAMVVDKEGLSIASTIETEVGDDQFGALVEEMWHTAARYMEKMSLGVLRRGTVDGTLGKMVVLSLSDKALVIATEPDVRLGMVSFQAARAARAIEEL